MVNYMALPPEVNSACIFVGAGLAPMVLVAAVSIAARAIQANYPAIREADLLSKSRARDRRRGEPLITAMLPGKNLIGVRQD